MPITPLFPANRSRTPQGNHSPEAAAAVAAVRILNQEYIDAARTNDATWFEEHLAEEAVVVLSNGQRLRKAGFLAMVKDEPRSYRSLTVRDATIRVFGATVQVDADAPWHLSDGSEGISRYIDTYLWLDGRWQVISAQITSLPKSTAHG